MTYSLIIPVFNEERTLPTLIEKLYELDDEKIEIIIIDDGSDDSTKEMLLENNRIISRRNKTNIGKGASIIKGVNLASNENIILFDGDLEVDVSEIPKLILKYEENNSDVLSGARWGYNSSKQNYDINLFGNYLINMTFNFLFKSNFNDVLCCIKILKLENFKSLNIKSKGFNIEVETMAKLVLNRSVIKEVEVKYKRRTTKEGKKLKLSDGWSIIWTILKLRFLIN